MRTTVLLFHPHLESSRINAELARTARGTQGVELRHLDALYPDHRIDVAAEQEVLLASDRIVLQFPLYWFSTPSLLAQWEHDVLTYGWAYGSGGTALDGKELGVAMSHGAEAADYARTGSVQYTVLELLRPLQATSAYIGTRFLTPFVTAGAQTISQEDLDCRARAYPAWLTGEVQTLGTFA